MRRGGASPLEAIAFIAVVVALGALCGLVDRPPFDDEIHTLLALERLGAGDILRSRLEGADVHPPLSLLVFKALQLGGVPLWGMRAVSLALSALAMLAAVDLALRAGGPRAEDPWARQFAFLVGLLCPLLCGVGDALRWYPLFAALSAGFLWSVLRANRPTLLGGLLLGLAGSTSFLAAAPAAAWAAWRYGVQRRFSLREDGPFVVLAGAAAAVGLLAFVSVAGYALGQREGSLLTTLPMAALGFLGGARVGLTPSPLLLPYAVALLFALLWASSVARDRGRDDAEAELRRALAVVALAGVAAAALLALAASVGRARTLLWLAPWLHAALILAALEGRRDESRAPQTALTLAALGMAALVTWGSLGRTPYPYKRNVALPVQATLEWIEAKAPAGALFVVSEPVLAYELARRGRCVVGPMDASPICLTAGPADARPLAIVRDHTFDAVPLYPSLARTQGRTLLARETFGRDDDAKLKRWLTGVELPRWIVRVDFWSEPRRP